jgi:hypothetical protein
MSKLDDQTQCHPELFAIYSPRLLSKIAVQRKIEIESNHVDLQVFHGNGHLQSGGILRLFDVGDFVQPAFVSSRLEICLQPQADKFIDGAIAD